jgi:diaminopimelate epimerase
MEPDTLAFPLTPENIRLICDRNFGVGSDGILALSPPMLGGDFGVRILNPDGSEAEKSGNGLRIFAKYLYEHGHTQERHFTVGTLGGLVTIDLEVEDGLVTLITVNMGGATFDDFNEIEVDGRRYEVTSLSVGNPHCVLIVDDLSTVDPHSLGPKIENHPAFPNRTNVQWAQVVAPGEVHILIWERGAGYTLASGSSSCAVAAACYHKGLTDPNMRIVSPGGTLNIRVDETGELWLRGPAEEVCSGDLSVELLRRLQASKERGA